jgi:hypothetical protein
LRLEVYFVFFRAMHPHSWFATPHSFVSPLGCLVCDVVVTIVVFAVITDWRC